MAPNLDSKLLEDALRTPVAPRDGCQPRQTAVCRGGDDTPHTPVREVERDCQPADQEHCRRDEQRNAWIAGYLKYGEPLLADKSQREISEMNRVALSDRGADRLRDGTLPTERPDHEEHLPRAQIQRV